MKKLSETTVRKLIRCSVLLLVLHFSAEAVFPQFTELSRENMISEGKFYFKDGILYSDAIVVKFRERVIDVPIGERHVNANSVRGEFQAVKGLFDRMDQKYGAADIIKQVPTARWGDVTRVNRATGQPVTIIDLSQLYTIRYPAPVPVDSTVNAFLNMPEVEFAHEPVSIVLYNEPNDPQYTAGLQWSLQIIKAHEAWEITHGSSKIYIGIVDEGTLKLHEDLQGKIDGGNHFLAGGVHGTKVAGVAAAMTNNEKGVASLGWDIRLYTYGVPDGDFSSPGEESYMADNIVLAANSTDVINLSWGTNRLAVLGDFPPECNKPEVAIGKGAGIPHNYQSISNAISNAITQGVVVVAAVGNNSINDNAGLVAGCHPQAAEVPWFDYPSSYEGVIGVSATKLNSGVEKFVDGWNYGSFVDVSAPGYNITTTVNGGYLSISGTSASAPLVSALAALILSIDSSRTPAQVEEILKSTTNKIGQYTYNAAGRNDYMGFGRINAFKAVSFGTQTFPPSTTWTQDVVLGGDIYLSGVNTVNSGVKMTILPGATLHFENGARLTIKGQLIAEGTAGNKITFRSINDNVPAASWDHIDLDFRAGPEAPTSIKYVHVQDCNIGVLGRYANNAVVENSTFQNCKIGPYAWYSATGTTNRMQILNNTITNNTRHGIYSYYSNPIISGNTATGTNDPSSNYGFGIYLRSSSAIVGNNTVTGSERDGIQAFGSGVAKMYYSVSNPLGGYNTITDNSDNGVLVAKWATPILGIQQSSNGFNTIKNNTNFQVRNNTGTKIMAECNYWGGAPSQTYFSGLVDYQPFLSQTSCFDNPAMLDFDWIYALFEPSPTELLAQNDVVRDAIVEATTKFTVGDYSGALQQFRAVVKDYPNSDGMYYALTLAYESFKELGKRQELRGYLTGLSNQQANSKVKRFGKMLLVHDLEGNSEFSEALSLGNEILSDNPSDVEANQILFSQGMIYAGGLDDPNKAAAKFNEIIRRFPGTDEAAFAAEQLEYLDWDGLGKKAIGPGADNNSLPIEYSLSNNYPNPFNPETRIEFALPEAGLTRLIIYDLRGREVAILVDGELSAGIHNLTWDASKAASGIYFYRLTSGSFVATRKMVLLK